MQESQAVPSKPLLSGKDLSGGGGRWLQLSCRKVSWKEEQLLSSGSALNGEIFQDILTISVLYDCRLQYFCLRQSWCSRPNSAARKWQLARDFIWLCAWALPQLPQQGISLSQSLRVTGLIRPGNSYQTGPGQTNTLDPKGPEQSMDMEFGLHHTKALQGDSAWVSLSKSVLEHANRHFTRSPKLLSWLGCLARWPQGHPTPRMALLIHKAHDTALFPSVHCSKAKVEA